MLGHGSQYCAILDALQPDGIKLLVPRQVSQGGADSDATIRVQVLMPCDHIIALPTTAHATTLGSLGRVPPTSAALVKSLPSSDDGEYATA